MPRRKYKLRVQCPHEGCDKVTYYKFDRKSDYVEAYKRNQERPWYCFRHDPDGRNLQPDSEVRRVIVKCRHPDAERFPSITDQHMWSTGSGFTSGQGWNAYAEDFPIGTEIVITVEIVLPDEDH